MKILLGLIVLGLLILVGTADHAWERLKKVPPLYVIGLLVCFAAGVLITCRLIVLLFLGAFLLGAWCTWKIIRK